MPTCSSCGGNFDDTFQFCPYCGREKQKPQESVKVDVVMRDSQSPMDCPKCHRVDSVSKVSAIVQGGTHQINGQIPVSYTTHDSEGWHSGTSYERYHATQQSDLASKLTPPPKPSLGWNWLLGLFLGTSIFIGIPGCLILSAAISMASIIIFSPSTPMTINLSGNESEVTGLTKLFFVVGILVIGFIMSIIPIGSFILWRKSKKSSDAKDLVSLQLWESAIQRWKQLYYCSRDDCIFIPGENSAHQVSNMKQVINWRSS